MDDHAGRCMLSAVRVSNQGVMMFGCSAPNLLVWPCQEKCGSGLSASAPLSDVSAPACTNGVYASSAACECRAEDHAVDHVVLHFPVHRPPHGVHGRTLLVDEKIECLLNTYPEI